MRTRFLRRDTLQSVCAWLRNDHNFTTSLDSLARWWKWERIEAEDVSALRADPPMTPVPAPWKKKLIQLILIERVRVGQSLCNAEVECNAGRQPSPLLAAAVNSGQGKIGAWLWILRESEPDRARFHSLIETLGFRSDDEEIRDLEKIDNDLEQYAHRAGEFAATAAKLRDENPDL